MERIPEDLYKRILACMPIPCVDIVIFHDGKALLVKRVEEPFKGEWWLPGGRILKGESLEDAARRKAKEETGLDVEIMKKIGSYETLHERGSLGTKGAHTVNIAFLARPGKAEIRLDSHHSSHRWIGHIEDSLNSYVKDVLRDSGVFRP